MSLRTRISLVAVLGILLVAAGLLISNVMIQRQIEERFADATLLGKSVLWKKILASEFKAMENGISSLARDKSTRDALQAGDRKALSETAATTFNLLSASGVIDGLTLINMDAKILYSAPKSRSGTSKNPLLEQALKSGKIQQGVIRDDDGNLKAVVVFALTIRGKPVGLGIYSRSLDDAMADFKVNDESDVLLYTLDGKIEHTTDRDIAKSLGIGMPEPGRQKLAVVEMSGRAYSAAMLPIFDADKKPIAHMVSVKDYTESYSRQRTLFAAAIGVAIFIVIGVVFGLYWYMGRSLKPLQAVVSNLQEIADGNLTSSIDITSSDEIGQLQTAMKDTVSNLRNMLNEVNKMTDQLAESSAHMHLITDQTRHGVERQHSDVELVASAMTEMTSTVQDIARNASHAAQAAEDADAEAQKGASVVDKAINSINSLASDIEQSTGVIDSLREHSLSIGAILEVIRSISEQTNLLALNAAIEAARAGEQGRGFAVVADEVRTLASRTQQSTQEIQSMIERLQSGAVLAVEAMEKSRATANLNVELAANAGKSLKLITSAVDTISQMNLQIASASEQQSSVAEEINQNVVNIKNIADMTADGAMNTLQASEELQSLAEDLRVLVSRFRL